MKLVGPIRKELAAFSVAIGGKEVLLEKHYDPGDQLELMAKSFLDKKLHVLSLQLQMNGIADDAAEGLIRKLVSLENFGLLDLSRFLDLVCRHTGSFIDPVMVIGSIAENVTRFQSDANHAVIMAGVLAQDIAAMSPKGQRDFTAALKGC